MHLPVLPRLLKIIFVLALVSLPAFYKPQTVSANSCGGLIPPQPAQFWAKGGPGPGEVTLSWEGVNYADRYAVAYGKESNKYTYGADRIGEEKSRSYTVKSLAPGERYFFRLAAAHGCASSPFSSEVSAIAGYGSGVAVKSPTSTAKSSRIWAKSGPKAGEVTLNWANLDNANDYHLVYGTENGKYSWGALNIGNMNSMTVKALAPGQGYYFALVPLVNGRSLYTTESVWGRAYTARIEVVQTTKEALIQRPIGGPAEDELPTPPPIVEGMSRKEYDGTDNDEEDEVLGEQTSTDESGNVGVEVDSDEDLE